MLTSLVIRDVVEGAGVPEDRLTDCMALLMAAELAAAPGDEGALTLA